MTNKKFLSESLVLLCDFHREQPWERWCSKLSNGISTNKGDITEQLRLLTHCGSLEYFNTSLNHFTSTCLWEEHPQPQPAD